jgi:subtilisin family serine protease/subtilisin-like proprotein convertase family protein
MSRVRSARPLHLNLQSLEARDVPTAAVAAPDYLVDRVLVKMTDDRVPKSPLMKNAESLGNGLFAVNLRTNIGVTRGVKHFQLQRGVAYAEPDYVIRADLTPNDPSYGTLWGMNNTGQSGGTVDADIDAPEAWDVSTGGGSVTVGVIDTGIDYRHQDLYKNVWINQSEIPTAIRNNLTDFDGDGRITFWDLNNASNQGAGKITDINGNGYIDGGDILTASGSGGWADGVNAGENSFTDDLVGWNFVSNNNNPLDDNNHGSHVSGTIGAIGNNSVGVVGVNWKAQFAALKFLNSNGSGSTSGAINALNYATARGIKVTNNSWGGGGFSQSLSDAITSAQNAGGIFVAAAGNAGTNNDQVPNYPSNYPQPNVVAVGASTRTDARASFSSYGATTVDVFAPGASILSTTRNNTYSTFDGTSMATPHVVGAIALVWDNHPTWTYQQVIDVIKATVDVKPAFQGISVTGGRLNVNGAIRYSFADTAGPKVNSSSFTGSGNAIDNLRVTFNEAIKASSFDATDVAFTGPGGDIGVTVTPVSGSTTQFDVSFASQSTSGNYTMVIGPNVTDLADNPMNQDGDGTNGEATQDQYTTTKTVDTAGPNVTASAFSGSATSINNVRFTFNEAITVSSFTASDVAFTGPGGSIAISSVTAVSGSGNTQFDVAFASQSAIGTYTMTIGPSINDTVSNPMNQDGDGTNGETPDDQYTTATTLVDTAGPQVTSSTFSGTANAIDNLRVTFNEAMDSTSFAPADVSFTGPGGAIGVTVTPVSGSTTQFDVSFASQSAPGDYTMVIGPNINDVSGNPMNQDGDGTNGEATQDQYTTTKNIPVLDTAGPRVNSSAFSGSATSINNVRFTFNEAITPSSFTASDVAFTGPGGSIAISSVTAVSGSGNTQFDVAFASQSALGTYTMTIGPGINDAAGNPMNQDGDGANGETPDDQYTTATTLADTAGPQVTSSTFSGTGNAIDKLHVVFNELIDATTFTSADVSFTGPGGSIGVTITPNSGSATQFDVSFASQSASGTYTMVIGPNINDVSGNPMNQDGDGTNGEATQDQYTTTKAITNGQTFNSGNVPLPIQFQTFSSLSVGTSLTIHDIDVKLNITHPADGELIITLYAPDFSTVRLVTNRGGTGANFTNTVLDDEASQAISAGSAPFNGSYRPEQALSAFDGKNASGTWYLVIVDTNPNSNAGTLNSWSITIA